ncbi:hypothetical protein [Candidatus Tisiphia endosymbiont of Dioctria rufipes]|uniref:hypothetical protein n=1 Tax=Candidatus Tisiphia endosymbiont of Dioctria rufipes TaxID=3066255 RepID=UPI00312CC25D
MAGPNNEMIKDSIEDLLLCLSKAIKKLEEEIAELTTDEKTVEQLEVLERQYPVLVRLLVKFY